MIGISVELFLMMFCDLSVLVHDILHTLVLSISIGFTLLNTVALGMQHLLYVVLCMGVLSVFGYLWLIFGQLLKE